MVGLVQGPDDAWLDVTPEHDDQAAAVDAALHDVLQHTGGKPLRFRRMDTLAAIFAAPVWLVVWLLTLGRLGKPILERR